MTPVFQRGRYECGVAVIAMLTGHDYDLIRRRFITAGWWEPAVRGIERDLIDGYLLGAGLELTTDIDAHPYGWALVISADGKPHAVVVLNAEGAVADPGDGTTTKTLDRWPTVRHRIGVVLDTNPAKWFDPVIQPQPEGTP